MRRSPRRPLILKRRKLPFNQHDPPPAPDGGPASTATTRPPPPPPRLDESFPKPAAPAHAASLCHFPDGVIQIMAHPTLPDTQVVVIPQTVALQSVIGALTAKGKEHGPNGPRKFILLGGGDAARLLPGSGVAPDVPAPPPPQMSAGGGGAGPGLVPGAGMMKQEPSHPDNKTLPGLKPLNRDLDCRPLDNSLTNMQWLGNMSREDLEPGAGPGPGPDAVKSEVAEEKENQDTSRQQESQADGVRVEVDVEMEVDTEVEMDMEVEVSKAKPSAPHRPPYSYMAMIQFAINSRPGRRMTLKDIYTWIEDHFPYFRRQSKPGWKNSIRHNLSLHDMFRRETSPDGKVSFWTIRPEANRCLTLDQVYKPGCEPTPTMVPVMRPLAPRQEHTGAFLTASSLGGASRGSVKRMKPLLPRSDSYLVPIQLPASIARASLYLPSCPPQALLRPTPQRTRAPRVRKPVRKAPKQVAPTAAPPPATALRPIAMEIKVEPACVHVTPRRDPRPVGGGAVASAVGSSRRKQRLVLPSHEEPVLLFSDSTFLDSGVASDTSTFQDPQRDGELSFETPVKGASSSSSSSSYLTFSTPSKPPGAEPWRVTPLGKGTASPALLDFSPIRTPGGPLHTPKQQHQNHQDYSSFSFCGTPFRELSLNVGTPLWDLATFSSPRGAGDSPTAGTLTTGNCSMEGLVLDTVNDSLCKVLVDISFSCLEDDDLGMANISWSELIPQML